MISKKICEHLGGTISASNSVLKTGTTFTFNIKLSGLREQSRVMPRQTGFFFESFNDHHHQLDQGLGLLQQMASISNLPPRRLIHQRQPSIVVPENIPCRCPQILVIDDNEFNIIAITLILQEIQLKLGGLTPFSLETDQVGLLSKSNIDDCQAFDGVNGVEKLETKLINCCKRPYKLVIVDLNMPRFNGRDMMIQIREYLG